jgi:hypothetical protein
VKRKFQKILVTYRDLRSGKLFNVVASKPVDWSSSEFERELRLSRFDFPSKLETIWDDMSVDEALEEVKKWR